MNISNISLRQLRIFLAVAEHHGFSRAGCVIGLTQSAMSHSISELENELGIRLFDRTTREVLLTQEGEDLSVELRRLLGELETTLSNAKNRGEQQRGLVHVATSPTISVDIMPRCIIRALKKHPQINIIIHDQVQQKTIQMVQNGQVDFGVIVEPLLPPDLYTEIVLEEPFYLVGPRNNQITQKAMVKWSDLQNEELVLLDYASGSRPLIDSIFSRQQITPHVIQELGHVSTIFRILQSGIGVSVIPQLALPSLKDSGLTICQLCPTETRRLLLARRHNRSLSPAATAVWTLIKQCCQV
ncbi:LysR family transcriptional regulator [Salmonella enterica]|nr:LysR family transcriptional regulator [Salmonella enterica]